MSTTANFEVGVSGVYKRVYSQYEECKNCEKSSFRKGKSYPTSTLYVICE